MKPTDSEKVALINDVAGRFYRGVEGWRGAPWIAELAYLLWAIADDSTILFDNSPPHREMLLFLKVHFPHDHNVWNYIENIE